MANTSHLRGEIGNNSPFLVEENKQTSWII
jgi:hypothetical protein